MTSPAHDQIARDLIEDLQLRDDDRTDDLRPHNANDPDHCANSAGVNVRTQ